MTRNRLSLFYFFGGPDRDRTGDLLNAIQARSQLRHGPEMSCDSCLCGSALQRGDLLVLRREPVLQIAGLGSKGR